MGVSESASTGISRVARFLTASLARELGILLCLSVLFPFMVHLIPIPEDARLGPRLLPVFYAPLLATLWGRARSAVAVALLAPWLNWGLTGHPSPPGAVVMTVQLLGFVVALRALLAGVGARWFLAVPAYFCGLAASAAVAATVPSLIGGRAVLAWATQSAIVGLPGITILLLITWLALRHYPPGAAAA